MSARDLLRCTPEEAKNIKIAWGITEEQIKKDIKGIREWLSKQTHLPQNQDDEFIRRMLQFNKFSLEKTKNKIDSYFTIPHLMPEFFENREPCNLDMQNLLDTMAILPLPKLTDDLRRVTLTRFMTKNSENINVQNFFKLVLVVADIRYMYDNFLTENIVHDFKYVQLKHVLQCSPMLKNIIPLLQKGQSDRIAGYHFLNTPPFAVTLINLLKSLLKEKISSRIYIHDNLDSLHKYIPKQILPKDYGGGETTIHELQGKWKQLLEAHNDWFLNRENRFSNENLRQGSPTAVEFLGLQGSFRQLNID